MDYFLFFTGNTPFIRVFEYDFYLFCYSITFLMPAQICDICNIRFHINSTTSCPTFCILADDHFHLRSLDVP